MYAQSMTRDEENRQHTSTVDNDIPEGSPEPPPPIHTPDKPTEQRDKPPSVELEGERRSWVSCDDGPTSDMTDAPSQVLGPGRRLEVQGKSRGIEADLDRHNVLEGTGHNGIHPGTEGNQHNAETNAQCRVRGPGVLGGEKEALGGIEGEWERQTDGDGVEMDRTRCRMDGATSGASGGSKRLDTRPLAETDLSQHKRRKYKIAHVPQPSTPPPHYARSLSAYVNPLHRRGRLKTRPRNVSYPRWTYQATRTRRGRIGRIERTGYVAYGLEKVGE